jgi:hypothetical protein
VESALENSHRGGHLWIFMAEPLPARDCRIDICGLALRLGILVKGGRRRQGIEVCSTSPSPGVSVSLRSAG